MENKDWDKFLESRITPEKEIETGKPLLRLDGSEIFVEGTLSCICGPAKSRKTFGMSFLLEQLLSPSAPGFESNFNGDILYFDTEMSEARVQMVSKRFSRPENITFFSIRHLNIRQRFEVIEEAIKRLKPSIVVIDGYKELVMDINDGAYATKLTNAILNWTTTYNVHITGVLHTNPGSNKPRGSLGTEIMNKCSLVVGVESRGSQTRMEPMLSRDTAFSPFVFTIAPNGKPVFKQSSYE